MRLLMFPFFFAYLLICLSISFVTILIESLGFLSSFLLTVGFFLLAVYFYLMRFTPTQPFALAPVGLDEDRPSAQDYIHYWEGMKSLQPTHRDILLNLAALYDYTGDATKAAEMKKQAQQVDPNYADVMK